MPNAQGGMDENTGEERGGVLFPVQTDLKRLLEKVIIELSLEVEGRPNSRQLWDGLPCTPLV